MVARFKMDRLYPQHQSADSCRVRILARGEQVLSNHRWLERCHQSGIRSKREISLLLRLDRRGAGPRLVCAIESGHARYAIALRLRAAQGFAFSARKRERRGKGGAEGRKHEGR